MLSNAYFLAKFRFDTAENEPAKICKIFEKCIFEKCIFEKCTFEKCTLTGLPATRLRRHRSPHATYATRSLLEISAVFIGGRKIGRQCEHVCTFCWKTCTQFDLMNLFKHLIGCFCIVAGSSRRFIANT